MHELKTVDLSVYPPQLDARPLVENINVSVESKQSIGIIGESGSGKSILCRSLVRLNDNLRYSGEIQYDRHSLLSVSEGEMENLRGREIVYLFQNAESALHKYVSVGQQVMDVIRYHFGVSDSEARSEAIELFSRVNFEDPNAIMDLIPSKLSGGMQQRVQFCIALACKPKILVVDEPTSSLDPINSEVIGNILLEARRERGLVTVSHNFALVSEVCDYVYVLKSGCIVAEGTPTELTQMKSSDYVSSLTNPRFG